MTRFVAGVTVSVVILPGFLGCDAGASSPHVCQILVGNHADTFVRSVVVDPNGLPARFGTFGVGRPDSLKGAGGQTVRFADDFTLSWEENGAAKEARVPIGQYAKKRKQIRSMAFYYEGSNLWRVVAQDDILPDAREVLP